MPTLPSSGTAERNQRRKLAFIPAWPVYGAVLAIIIAIVVIALTR
jgi:hypothetical protein